MFFLRAQLTPSQMHIPAPKSNPNTILNPNPEMKVTNLVTSDCERLVQAVTYFHFLWAGILELLSSIALAWHYIGPSALAGLCLMLILIPIQTFIGQNIGRLRSQTVKASDQRIKAMNEVFRVGLTSGLGSKDQSDEMRSLD